MKNKFNAMKKKLFIACFGLIMSTVCFSQSPVGIRSDVNGKLGNRESKGFYSSVQISMQVGNRQTIFPTHNTSPVDQYPGWSSIVAPGWTTTYVQTSNIKMHFYPAVMVTEGYRFNAHWAAGLGVGLEVFDYNLYPAFAEVRYTLWDNQLSPYFALKAGNAFSLSKTKHYDDEVPIPYYDYTAWNSDLKNKGGLMLHPEIGVKLPISEKIDLQFSVAYWYQKIESTVYKEYGGGSAYFDRWIYKESLNRLSFGVAVLFR
jgi:hypothetical protein